MEPSKEPQASVLGWGSLRQMIRRREYAVKSVTTCLTSNGPRSRSADYSPQAKSGLCLFLCRPQARNRFYIF